MEYGKSKLIKLLTNTPREGWNNQKLKDLIDSLWRDPVLLRWSGFENAGGPDTLISWDAVTKIFSIEPAIVTFGFYQYRYKLSFHKRSLIEPVDITESLAEGRYVFFYSYDDELLKHVVSFIHNPTETQINEIFLYKTEIANLYWDAAAGEALHFGDDRHGSEWQPQMHRYLQNAFGARRKSGLQFTGYSLNGDGSLNTHAQFNITGGVMLHDDFEMTIPTSSNSIPVLYSFGTYPRFLANNGYAFAGAGRVYFNSGQISLAQADSGNFVLYHIFATNEILTASRKIISVMGIAQYTTLADAYQGVTPELDSIVTYMPQQGRCYLGSIIIQTSDDYTNDVKARIVALTGNETHPPVTIAEGSKPYLFINEKQELEIDVDALPGGGGGGETYDWNIHGPEQVISNLAEPENVTVTIDGTGAVDETIPAGTYAIVALNSSGETLPVNVPEMVILVDTTSVTVDFDTVPGATGYRVYNVATGLYYELLVTSWNYVTETPATAGTIPVANTAYIYQTPFTIDNGDTVEFTGEGIDIKTSTVEGDDTKKIVKLSINIGELPDTVGYTGEFYNSSNEIVNFNSSVGNPLTVINGLIQEILPEPFEGLYLLFDDIANVPVADANSVADWNAFFKLPTYGTEFTNVIVDGNYISLMNGNINHLKYNIFLNNTHLIEIGDSAETIEVTGYQSFRGCTNLIDIYLPSVIETEDGSFYGCTSLVTFELNLLVTARHQSFRGCVSATTFILPQLQYAGQYCFENCPLVIEFNFPSLLELGDGVFSSCTFATTFVFPMLETILGYNTFAYCYAATTFYMPSLLTFGQTVNSDACMALISGNNITLTIPAALMTCNSGNPDGDIQYLQATNTVTVIQV